MDPAYIGREQTLAKHFILKKYLQGLAYKVLRGNWNTLSYVDGFSGPWDSNKEDGSDTSFMIALEVLRTAKQEIEEQTGVEKTINCFFCENNPEAYKNLEKLVDKFHDPDSRFNVYTHDGAFETAVPHIPKFWGKRSFRLIFIDPLGWTGYPLKIISPLLQGRSTEVLLNFMYDFINRFNASDDPKIIRQFDQILGGEGWQNRLDPNLPRGEAVETLFKNELAEAGSFHFVASARIEQSVKDRPHFDIIFGTKSFNGLAHFREVEHNVLKSHYEHRQQAKLRKTRDADEAAGQKLLFEIDEIKREDTTFEGLFEAASDTALAMITQKLTEEDQVLFDDLAVEIMEKLPLRLTNIKDICVTLEQEGFLENTWKPIPKRKPDIGVQIRRKI